MPTSTMESASTVLKVSTRILRVLASNSTPSVKLAIKQTELVSPAIQATFLRLEIASSEIALLRVVIPTVKE